MQQDAGNLAVLACEFQGHALGELVEGSLAGPVMGRVKSVGIHRTNVVQDHLKNMLCRAMMMG